MYMSRNHSQWLLIRKKTFVAFCIICFGLGFEYSLIFPSLWYYISEVIKTENDELFYGIALAAYPVSSIIGAFSIARYADRTKRTRVVIVFLLSCEVLGNLLYVLHFSPLFPIIGRLIAGFGDVANIVMVAEIARSYETNEITSRISWTVMFFSIGFALSPGMNIVFKMFDFYIGPVHIVYANLPGLFMAICFSIIMVFTYFMVSDVSRDFDYKQRNEMVLFNHRQDQKLCHHLKHKMTDSNDGVVLNEHEYIPEHELSYCDNNETVAKYRDNAAYPSKATTMNYENIRLKDFDDANHCINLKSPYRRKKKRNSKDQMFQTIKSILKTFDLVLLLVFGFVSSYTLFGFDTLMALVASKYLKFGVSQTSIIFIIDGVLYGFVLLAIKKASAKYTDFHIMIFAVVLQLFGLVAILCLSLYNTNIYFNYICLSVYIIAFATTWSIEEVLTRSLFGKMVPSSCQSYSEGIRRSVSSTAFIISGISTAGFFRYLPIICSVLIVLTLLLLCVFIVRKKSLIAPTPQFYLGDLDDRECLIPDNSLVFL